MSDSLNGELRGHDQSREVGKSEVNKLAANNNQAYERLQPLERCSRNFNLRFYNIPENSGENCVETLQGYQTSRRERS